MGSPPDVLICSGLDPSGGAGFLADARVVSLLGGRPCGVITAQTVQNTEGMRSSHEIDREVFGAQLNALLTDIEVKAVKIGLLGSPEVIKELAEQLDLTSAPVVWDPIAAPTQGAPRFGREVLETALRELGRHLRVITPNSHELALLAGTEVRTLDAAVASAKVLSASAGVAVLVKGGHLGGEHSVDVLCDGGVVEYFEAPRIAGADVHGTGCALSSAIATQLAHGSSLVEACRHAKQFVAAHILTAVRPGRGAPAIV